MLFRDGKVVDVNFAPLLLKLGEKVGDERADDGRALQRGQDDRAIILELSLEIGVARRGGLVGGGIFERLRDS